MTSSMESAAAAAAAAALASEVAASSKLRRTGFAFADWQITVDKSHILTKAEEEAFSSALRLPHLPDMLFARNRLRLSHADGFGVEFAPLDALKTVNDHEDLVHVANAEDWIAARSDNPHVNKIIHPFDWTFSPSDYRGSLVSSASVGGADEAKCLVVRPTDLRIDYDKLRQQEKILFHDEAILYEDELDDNGCSLLSVKLRVMASGFFALMRFYLRVDGALVRVHDTRLYFELENRYLLREYSEREARTSELRLPISTMKDSNAIAQHLTLKKEITERLDFPS